jgi:hypothetical protein
MANNSEDGQGSQRAVVPVVTMLHSHVTSGVTKLGWNHSKNRE